MWQQQFRYSNTALKNSLHISIMEQQKVLTRRHPVGYGLEKSLEAVRNPTVTSPITQPSSNVSPPPPRPPSEVA